MDTLNAFQNLESPSRLLKRDKDNIIQEVKKKKLSILGISESSWSGNSQLIIDSHTVYSDGEDQTSGVGIIIKQKMPQNKITISAMRDLILLIKLSNRNQNLSLRVCTPSASEKSIIDAFFE